MFPKRGSAKTVPQWGSKNRIPQRWTWCVPEGDHKARATKWGRGEVVPQGRSQVGSPMVYSKGFLKRVPKLRSP